MEKNCEITVKRRKMSGNNAQNDREAMLAIAKENFKLRFTARRKELRISQRDLAQMLDVTTNSIQTYEAGCLPRGTNLVLAAKALNCSVDWLLGMDRSGDCVSLDSLDDSPQHCGKFIKAQRISDQVNGHVFDDAVLFNTDWLKENSSNSDNVCLIFPSPSERAGCMMLIDKGSTSIQQGCQYLIEINGHYSTNRVSIRPGGTYLISNEDDKNFPPYEVPATEVKIIGRIFWSSCLM